MKIAGQEVEREATSREGKVYLTSSHVYKMRKSGNHEAKGLYAYENWARFKLAEERGVPVPEACKFTAFMDGDEVQGVRLQRMAGRFFQLSKPGGTQTLVNEINAMTNSVLLGVVLQGLRNAAEAGLSDPQGFICQASSPPLCFIDVHFNTGRNGAFDYPIEAAEARLLALGA